MRTAEEAATTLTKSHQQAEPALGLVSDSPFVLLIRDRQPCYPPATAGMIDSSARWGITVFRPSRKRMSSPST